MKTKTIILILMLSCCGLAMTAQYERPGLGGFKYTNSWERSVSKPITRLRFSDAELIASGSLFLLGVVLPHIDKNNTRQGAEIACFTFSVVLFTEGLRMRNNVKDKKRIRYNARRKIPASKY
jgi:hypothetical protein